MKQNLIDFAEWQHKNNLLELSPGLIKSMVNKYLKSINSERLDDQKPLTLSESDKEVNRCVYCGKIISYNANFCNEYCAYLSITIND